MNGIVRLVAHVDQIFAYFDEVFADKPPEVEFPKTTKKREAGETLVETWGERIEGAEGVFIEWLTRTSFQSGSRRPRIGFDGTPPKAWTPARAAIEKEWPSRDAIFNAISKAAREGITGPAFADRVAEIYGGWLERREELVNRARLRALVTDAIRDAMRGNLLAGQAVEALRDELRRLFDPDLIPPNHEPGDGGFNSAEEWKWVRQMGLFMALENARGYGDALPDKAEGGDDVGTADDGTVEMKKPKRSTVSGEAREKIIAKLTEYHGYATDSCLIDEPIGNNELARQLDVSASTTSEFFKDEFGGWDGYRQICSNKTSLLTALKLLNGEFTPKLLLKTDIRA